VEFAINVIKYKTLEK